MTVETVDNRINYVSSGSVGPYAFNFKTYDGSHIKVYDNGELYTGSVAITLNSNQDLAPGGTLELNPAIDPGRTVTIQRLVPKTQLVNYTVGDSFPAETHERALDNLTFLVQQNSDEAGRNIRAPVSDPIGTDMQLPDVSTRAGKFLGFDALGQPQEVEGSSGDAILREDLKSGKANLSDWQHETFATYLSAITFSVASVTDFHVGRRIKTSEGAYGVITDVSGTTVTVEVSSGALTAALASVQLGPAADSTSAAVQYYQPKSGESAAGNYSYPYGHIERYWLAIHADYATALQSAADSVKAFGGGIVSLDAKEYEISSTVIFDNKVSLEGKSGKTVTSIKLATGFTATESAGLLFKNSANGVINSLHIKKVSINCNEQNAHGIRVYQPYDNSSFDYCDFIDIGDNYNGLRIEPHPTAAGTKISQTVLLSNCSGIHKNATATAPTFYAEQLQEAVFNNIKAFGGYANAIPQSVPIHLVDCRGVTIVGGGVANTSTKAIKVEALNRKSSGITIIGMTYENVIGGSGGAKCLQIVGNATNRVNGVSVIGTRIESPIDGGFEVDYADNIDIEFGYATGIIGVSGDTVTNSVIKTRDKTKITDNSPTGYNLVIATPSAVTGRLSFSRNMDIAPVDSPEIRLRAESRSEEWRILWSASASADNGMSIRGQNGDVVLNMKNPSANNPRIGFLGAAPISRPTVAGSRGANAALEDLLTKLATLGLITDTTTA